MKSTDLLTHCRRVSALIEHGVISSEDAVSVATVLHAAERSLATVRDDERAAFEEWISAPPYEDSVERYPATSDERTAWPGCYVNHKVHLAWDAWQAALGIEVPKC